MYVQLCIIFRSGINYGGKGSTDYAVKGYHRNVPQQLILELKDICQVLFCCQLINFIGFHSVLISKFMSCSVFQDNMSVDYNERHFHGKPQNSFHKAVNIPDVVVYARLHSLAMSF